MNEPITQTCHLCNGSGEGRADGSTCPDCKGRGSSFSGKFVCPECDADTLIDDGPCSKCCDAREESR